MRPLFLIRRRLRFPRLQRTYKYAPYMLPVPCIEQTFSSAEWVKVIVLWNALFVVVKCYRVHFIPRNTWNSVVHVTKAPETWQSSVQSSGTLDLYLQISDSGNVFHTLRLKSCVFLPRAVRVRIFWHYTSVHKRPILRFFAPHGRHVVPMGVKFGTEEGTEAVPNFDPSGATTRV